MTAAMLVRCCCPGWCVPDRHNREDQELAEATGVVHHECSVAEVWLPEVRRCRDTVTRPAGGTLVVNVERDDSAGGPVSDSVVTVRNGSLGDGERLVLLLPGEARDLAAALLRATDVMLFD